MRKSLHLRRETLSELADVQLEGVVGGLTGPTCMPTCQTCLSLHRCPSVPITDCPWGT